MATTQDCLQILYEETPRYENAVTTTPYRLSTVARYLPVQTYAFNDDPQGLDRRDELRGQNAPPAQLVDGHEPAGSLSMRAYVNDLIFLLGLAGFVGTPTAGGAGVNDLNSVAVPTGATLWNFVKKTGLTAQTAQFTACYADEAVWTRGQGVGISRMSMDAAGAVSADLMGIVWGRLNSDPNLTPSFDSITIPPLRSGDIAVTPWLTGAGTADDFNFEIANPLERYRGLNASYYARELQFGDDVVQVTGARPARTLEEADVDAIAAMSTFAARATWTSPVNVAATATKYRMIVDMPACQYTGGSADDLRNARRFGGNYNWLATLDPSAGYDVKFQLVGAVSAVATYP